MTPTANASLSLIRAIPMQLAEDLIHLLGYTPPVPLTTLAQDLDTVLVEQHLGRRGLLGYSWSTSTGDRIVVVNVDQPPPVVRFTIAHELMHRLLHAGRGTTPLQLPTTAQDLTEVEANAGAGALLMPAGWLMALVEGWNAERSVTGPWTADLLGTWSTTVGPRWARAAGVSLTALGYRLIDVGVVSSDGARSWREGSPRWGA